MERAEPSQHGASGNLEPQAIHQRFARMDIQFNEMRDRFERLEVLLTNQAGREAQRPQRVPRRGRWENTIEEDERGEGVSGSDEGEMGEIGSDQMTLREFGGRDSKGVRGDMKIPSPQRNNEDLPPSKKSNDMRKISMENEIMKIHRAQIFQTRCLIQDKVCTLKIDGGSCSNLASTLMVDKLGLPMIEHPNPYTLHWLTDIGEVLVNKQVKVSLIIGRYKDEILLDVVPMNTVHILLGRPWQYDRKVTHDGRENRYSFERDGRKIKLIPLTPQEVYEDQIYVKRDFEKEREKEMAREEEKGRKIDMEREKEKEREKEMAREKEREREKEMEIEKEKENELESEQEIEKKSEQKLEKKREEKIEEKIEVDYYANQITFSLSSFVFFSLQEIGKIFSKKRPSNLLSVQVGSIKFKKEVFDPGGKVAKEIFSNLVLPRGHSTKRFDPGAWRWNYGDSRTNHLEEGGNDEDRTTPSEKEAAEYNEPVDRIEPVDRLKPVDRIEPVDRSDNEEKQPPDPLTRQASQDPLSIPVGPMTRARAKRLKETLSGLIQEAMAKEERAYPDLGLKRESKILHLIQLGPDDCGPD